MVRRVRHEVAILIHRIARASRARVPEAGAVCVDSCADGGKRRQEAQEDTFFELPVTDCPAIAMAVEGHKIARNEPGDVLGREGAPLRLAAGSPNRSSKGQKYNSNFIKSIRSLFLSVGKHRALAMARGIIK